MLEPYVPKKKVTTRGYGGTYTGKYMPRFPKKYRGDFKKVVYRSSWELRFMVYCDKNPNVIEWSSEEVVVPYISPKDQDWHRYFVDFWVKMQTTQGVREFLIEVKPKAQCNPPKKRSRTTQKYLNECTTYEVNQAKWEAARAYCAKKNMEFLIFTEDDLT